MGHGMRGARESSYQPSPPATMASPPVWNPQAQRRNFKAASRAISWTKVVHARSSGCRAGGRRRINAERHRRGRGGQRDLVVQLVDAYGLEHGVRQRIANSKNSAGQPSRVTSNPPSTPQATPSADHLHREYRVDSDAGTSRRTTGD